MQYFGIVSEIQAIYFLENDDLQAKAHEQGLESASGHRLLAPPPVKSRVLDRGQPI